MTRQEFDRSFAATQDNTDGFSDEQLAEINDAVFAAVSEISLDDYMVHQNVKNEFGRAFDAA